MTGTVGSLRVSEASVRRALLSAADEEIAQSTAP